MKTLHKKARQRYARIRTVEDAKDLLGRIVHQLQHKEISDGHAKAISYCARGFARLAEVTEQEQRLKAIEKTLKQMEKEEQNDQHDSD